MCPYPLYLLVASMLAFAWAVEPRDPRPTSASHGVERHDRPERDPRAHVGDHGRADPSRVARSTDER